MGDDQRSFLTVVRSLGRREIVVDVCPNNFKSPSLKSRYIRSILQLPPYNYDVEEWLASFEKLLSRRDYDLVIPCSDQFIVPIMRHLSDLGPHLFAVPNKKAYDIFYDKWSTKVLANGCGVPISDGRKLRKGDTADCLISEFGLPLVIKARRSFSLDRLDIRREVRVLRRRDEVEAALPNLRGERDYIVEKYFYGVGIGVSVLALDGEVLASFQHQRVHEPKNGGGSSYRKSVPLSPRLEEYVCALSKRTFLTGVSMFEFKLNPETSDVILVEVNARFWGSLPLAVGSGVDFPYYLYELLVKKQIPRPKSYRIDFHSRNFTSDLYYLIERATSDSTSKKLRELIIWCMGLCGILIGREKIDSFSWRDPIPFVCELSDIAAQFLSKVVRKMPLYSYFSTCYERRRMLKALKAANRRAPKIAVVCSGNICRSPFAAEFLKRSLGEAGVSARVESYGLIPRSGRRSPKEAVVSARKHNIDLSSHISRYATDHVLSDADLILIFDEQNARGIQGRGLKTKGKVVTIGKLTDIGVIQDPFGSSIEEFEKVYQKIVKCIICLIWLIVKVAKDK